MNFSIFYCLLFLTFIIPNANATILADYNKEILNNCSKTSSLLIKKSMIEMIKYEGTDSCTKKYTKKLIDSCMFIDCDTLIFFYHNAKERNSGNVFGK